MAVAAKERKKKKKKSTAKPDAFIERQRKQNRMEYE